MFSLNIVCTSIGRETLPRLIESFKDQLDPTDIFTIITDINHEFVIEVLSRYEFKFKGEVIDAHERCKTIRVTIWSASCRSRMKSEVFSENTLADSLVHEE
jgi:hypothetical protein